ncbi:hypothetical protein [Streptomyces sp. WAC 01529]|uniref:hypothetical protein n=1 Tax=Streptomyces sp. WAC 01529 TaxID=2203205 RepID=UPI0013E032B8|nr:hypothetical protein [Streptomyces sp. WAC 01529]
MAKRRAEKKTDPNDEQELTLAFDAATGLMLAITVEPRTTPIPEKPSRRGKKNR